jgi:hypothetical protein
MRVEGGEEMRHIKVTLCPQYGGCPEVESTESGVTIGEKANTVKLTHGQWNELVARVRGGELCEV